MPGVNSLKIRVQIEIPARKENTAADKEMRRARITKKDIEKYGFTPRCEGCRAIISNGPHQSHSEDCRKNIEDRMKMTPRSTTNSSLR